MNKVRETVLPHLPYIAFIALVNIVLYHEYWTGHRIISGRDFLFLTVPTINFQTDCVSGGSLPLWNPFINFGFPWVEHYLNTSLEITNLFFTFISGSSLMIVQRAVFFWILLGGIGIYLCVTEPGSSKTAGMIAGICFMFSGQIFMLPFTNQMIYNACMFPFVLYGYLRAKKQDDPLSLLSIFFLTQFILGGYMATSVVGFYLFSLYVLLDAFIAKKPMFGIKYLAVTFVASFLLASPKLLPLYRGMTVSPRLSGGQGSVPDPYNLLSLYDLQSLLIPVKHYFSVSIGLLCIVAFVHGVIKKRISFDPLLVIAVLSGWLLIADSDGTLSLLRGWSYYLPFMKMVRVEWLHWYYPTMFALLYCAQFFDGYLQDENGKLRAATTLAYASIVTAVFLWQYDHSLHLAAYILTLTLAAGWLLLPVVVRQGPRPLLFAAAAAVLLTIEFGALIGRVDINDPPARDQQYITIRTSDQWNVSHSFQDDNIVAHVKTLSFIRDEERPTVNDSRNWPVLISAINAQYQENLFVDLLNQKRFAGWYNNIQAKEEFIEMFYGPELAAMDNKPLYGLFDGSGAPHGSVSLDKVSCTEFLFTVSSDRPVFLLLNQMHDSRWSVTVDGKADTITRANRHFMGIALPPSAHAVRFMFNDAVFNASLVLSMLTLVVLLAAKYVRSKRTASADRLHAAA